MLPRDCLLDLVSRRYTQTEIASGTGITQPTISRVLAGSGMTYENGARVVDYYETQKSKGFPKRDTEEEAAA